MITEAVGTARATGCSGTLVVRMDSAFYGAPAVAAVVIVLSFFTAKRRAGIAVPLSGWALMIADVALMAASVSG